MKRQKRFPITYPTIYIIATEIAGNHLFPWKDVNWLTCSIIYIEVIRENIKYINIILFMNVNFFPVMFRKKILLPL